jgi:hypothetical protein
MRVARPETPTWPVAAGSLALGFAVAEVTGVRPIGGIVLVLGLAWCALAWRQRVAPPVWGGLVVFYLVLFALSHVLGHVIGAWPSVAVVAACMAVATLRLADRPARGGSTRRRAAW